MDSRVVYVFNGAVKHILHFLERNLEWICYKQILAHPTLGAHCVVGDSVENYNFLHAIKVQFADKRVLVTFPTGSTLVGSLEDILAGAAGAQQ